MRRTLTVAAVCKSKDVVLAECLEIQVVNAIEHGNFEALNGHGETYYFSIAKSVTYT